MSAQANIIAFDGAATPVSHTLVPVNSAVDPKDNALTATWREALTTVPLYAQIQCVMKQTKLKSGVWRVSTTVSVPVMESVSGQNSAGYTAAQKVAYVNTVVITGYYHERATIAERRLARQMAINIAGNVATSVTPVATGAAPELLDQNIVAS